MEQKIIIRTTAYSYNKKLAMAFTWRSSVEVNVEQFDTNVLLDACYDARDKLKSVCDDTIEIEKVSAGAVIIINGITFNSKRVVLS